MDHHNSQGHGEFFITTPIYYVNGVPHIGHAYTTIVADVIARWRATQGEIIIFSTGVDENAQKTVDAAKKSNEEIHVYTDRMAEIWESTWQKMGISYTDFIRTTDAHHLETVNDFWGRMDAAGDLYMGTYQGLYCKGHEAFMKEDELVDGLCPEHKTAPELVKEDNYFFRLSNYQQKLLDFYETHEDFVAPAHRFQEVKSFVEQGLEDISFSREKKEWGIPVPNDPNQVIYVWADALVNYISVVGIERWEDHPADVHIMAKDIIRFHAVIWPAMLMSAGLPLPGQILAHGYFTNDGVKMSKTIGNIIDPLAVIEEFSNDALRYFLVREVPFGEDGDFSEAKMKERYNADLANGLGNFVARVLTIAEKSSVPEGKLDEEFAVTIRAMQKNVTMKMGQFKFADALAAIWAAITFGDRYVNEKKIWEIKDEDKLAKALFNLVSLLEAVTRELAPFMPETARILSSAVEHKNGTIIVKKPEILFPRIK